MQKVVLKKQEYLLVFYSITQNIVYLNEFFDTLNKVKNSKKLKKTFFPKLLSNFFTSIFSDDCD